MNFSDTEIDSIGIGRRREQFMSEKSPGIALGGDNLGGFLLHIVGKAWLGARQFFQGHIVLVVQIAQPVADPGPSGVFGQRAFYLIVPQLGDQPDNEGIDFLVGDRSVEG